MSCMRNVWHATRSGPSACLPHASHPTLQPNSKCPPSGEWRTSWSSPFGRTNCRGATARTSETRLRRPVPCSKHLEVRPASRCPTSGGHLECTPGERASRRKPSSLRGQSRGTDTARRLRPSNRGSPPRMSPTPPMASARGALLGRGPSVTAHPPPQRRPTHFGGEHVSIPAQRHHRSGAPGSWGPRQWRWHGASGGSISAPGPAENPGTSKIKKEADPSPAEDPDWGGQAATEFGGDLLGKPGRERSASTSTSTDSSQSHGPIKRRPAGPRQGRQRNQRQQSQHRMRRGNRGRRASG